MPFDDKKKIERLKKKEVRLVTRGNKAVDEGRDKRADRILGRAAKVENRIITLEEKKNKPTKNQTPKYLGKQVPNTVQGKNTPRVAPPTSKIVPLPTITKYNKMKK